MVGLAQCGQELGTLESKVPAGWMASARLGGSPSEPVGPLTRRSKLTQGWGGGRVCEGTHVTIREYSVRLGSALQVDHVRQRRAEGCSWQKRWAGPRTHRGWVTEEMQRLTETLPRLWQETKWENSHKEAYWRLTVDGIPLLGNSHMRRAGVARYGCGVRPGQAESRDTPQKHH
jgi:hypothetical protein